MTGMWPAATEEIGIWRVSGEIRDYLGNRRAQRIDGQEFSRTIPPRIANLNPLTALDSATLEHIVEATSTVREFEATTKQLPPFMHSVLLRSESASSSQVENLSASARTLAETEIGLRNSANAELISANTAAMIRAFSLESPITVDSLLAMHHELLAKSRDVNAGRLREVDVWIGGSDFAPIGASFVGPPPELLPGLLQDLIDFISSPALEAVPLLSAAIAHAQFEMIHPFEDGNGRVGRALIHSFLRRSGLVTVSPLPLSAGLLSNTATYFAALNSYRKGDISSIATVFANAADNAALLGGQLAREIEDLRDGWRQQITARSDATTWKALDQLFLHPVVSIPLLVQELHISDRAAGRALTQLSQLGIVTQSGRDRRQQTWQAPAVLALLDDFAAHAVMLRADPAVS